jgi:hypothetical protein
MARLSSSKGAEVYADIAKAWAERYPTSDLRFLAAGQGDFAVIKDRAGPKAKIGFVGDLHGIERSAWASNALAIIQPTRFLEPFGGSVVEAALCGTPGIVADQGGMTETVVQGVTGYRCKTLGDYLWAIDHADRIDRKAVGDRARKLYTLDATRPLYIRAIETLHELCCGGGVGWYSQRAFSFSDEIVRNPSTAKQAVEFRKPDDVHLKIIERLTQRLKDSEEKVKELTLRPMLTPKDMSGMGRRELEEALMREDAKHLSPQPSPTVDPILEAAKTLPHNHNTGIPADGRAGGVTGPKPELRQGVTGINGTHYNHIRERAMELARKHFLNLKP